jgi:hypothetical protein
VYISSESAKCNKLPDVLVLQSFVLHYDLTRHMGHARTRVRARRKARGWTRKPNNLTIYWWFRFVAKIGKGDVEKRLDKKM